MFQFKEGLARILRKLSSSSNTNCLFSLARILTFKREWIASSTILRFDFIFYEWRGFGILPLHYGVLHIHQSGTYYRVHKRRKM